MCFKQCSDTGFNMFPYYCSYCSMDSGFEGDQNRIQILLQKSRQKNIDGLNQNNGSGNAEKWTI